MLPGHEEGLLDAQPSPQWQLCRSVTGEFLLGLDKRSERLSLLSVLWSGIPWALGAKWKYKQLSSINIMHFLLVQCDLQLIYVSLYPCLNEQH